MAERYQDILERKGFSRFQEKLGVPPDILLEVYSRPSGYFLGSLPIYYTVEFERSTDFSGVKVLAGVNANAFWRDMRSLSDIQSVKSLLPPQRRDFRERWSEKGVFEVVSRSVPKLTEGGYFKYLAEDMMTERRNGINFIKELVPRCLSGLPGYGTVIDRYDVIKEVLFANQSRDEAISVEVYPDEFQISVCEMQSEEGGGDDSDYVWVDDVCYLVTNRVAVWYPTDTPSTAHPAGNLQRQLELLKDSFEVLQEWLETRDRYLRQKVN